MRSLKRRIAAFLGLFFSFLPFAGAAEFTAGSIRLVLHEETGRFSLYSIHENSRGRYEALFADQDPRTSFLSVSFNDRIYKLGDTSSLRTRIGGDSSTPSFIFESSFLLVTEEFSFLTTPGQNAPNGVRIKITIENRSPQQARTGARFLLDTDLGENSPPPFVTDKEHINSEIFFEKGSPDRWWVSRREQHALMGSMFGAVAAGEEADSLYFANWKRLNDVSWKMPYQQGRNFNMPPYSMGDSAVCYYFEPRPLNRGESCSFTILLAAAGGDGFVAENSAGETPEPGEALARILSESTVAAQAARTGAADAGAGDSRRKDLDLLHSIIEQIDGYIASGSVTEDDIAIIETILNQVRERGNSLRDNPASR